MDLKLVIQIPCWNEEKSLPSALADLPRQLDGFDTIEWLVIDDGSADATVDVAIANGVDHVVALPYHQGLASAFMAGLAAGIERGADVIVNTDADNQYDARFIPDLVAPILEGRAQIVVGARPIDSLRHFSLVKKALQKIGSAVVRLASGTSVPDAPSGFRAIHREAAKRLYVFDPYTYTLETIIQAGRKNIPITWVPVEVNGETRPSKLVSSAAGYVARSVFTILRIFAIYKPLRFFGALAVIVAAPGVAALLRFLFFYAIGAGDGHVQSLVISAALLSSASVLFMGGVLAELISANRMLLEEARARRFDDPAESASDRRDGRADG